MVSPVKETVLNFGPRSCLVGVLCQPAGTRTADVVVVLLNSGIVHRVGPARLYVRLARRLAEHGYPVLRMDLPGLGDSEPLRGARSPGDQNVLGVSAAMDRLEALGVAKRFVLLGLCAGATTSFQLACVEERVAGVVLIDPPTLYPTWKHGLRRALSQISRPVVWGRLVSGRYGVTRKLWRRLRKPAGSTPTATGNVTPPHMQRQAVRGALALLAQRRVRLLLAITGAQREVYSYEDQFVDAFPGIGLERIVHTLMFPSADHTFTRESERARLERGLLDWLDAGAFPPLRSDETEAYRHRDVVLSAEAGANLTALVVSGLLCLLNTVQHV